MKKCKNKHPMMFRAMSEDTNSWVYGGLGIIDDVATHIIKYDKDTKQFVGIKIRPETVCQHMGIIDKNKIPIYEHDLLETYTTGNKYNCTIVQMDFNLSTALRKYASMEVCGNAYEKTWD